MNDLIEIGDYKYQIGKLSALDQLHVSRRIAPVIPTIAPLLVSIVDAGLTDLDEMEAIDIDVLKTLAPSFQPFAEALAEMTDEHTEYVLSKCMSVVRRKTDNGFAAVWRGKSPAFDDMEMSEIIPLVIAVLRSSLGNFMAGLATSQTKATEPQ
ncbi:MULTISPECIES: phage tail assembly chaperone [unclassified Acinetobacter]|uniref:phage tail assembly chaperone n=1 Tax=unclassified Acinetobacter TaxID=196816 RepID=UPI002447D766|nr:MULTISPECIES: hypothetical protein [unclassified Acinetobacter]MDH0030316.1 hypothetical protein [Acinetobacter sp. GD04021]MDH0885884.1 hypothetical protein [Acinetobacter sp. GD03873]MDH1082504.1 hypothetical protein [Acinetobacter sp. GD03983]MDH2189104.1 hypothetical protein [Acinetobacter sp. GD03645]MDH2202292.1 hypothetical protein [Acinetobacter sp. GD03647]